MTELTTNEECGEAMDDLSNMLADAATEVLEGQFAAAKAIIDDITKGMVEINAYIAEHESEAEESEETGD